MRFLEYFAAIDRLAFHLSCVALCASFVDFLSHLVKAGCGNCLLIFLNPVFQIRRGKEDNLGIISHIPP